LPGTTKQFLKWTNPIRNNKTNPDMALTGKEQLKKS
jgi:hypothetical protein